MRLSHYVRKRTSAGIVDESKFLSGRNDRNWVADFDWLLKTENAVKVLEDRYGDGRDRAAEEAAERRRRADEKAKADLEYLMNL